MKFENKVARLLEESDPQQIIAQLVKQTSWDKVLLSVSNLLVFKAQGYPDKGKKKEWMKNAKAVHKVMEECKAELAEKSQDK
jgi:hypothetical protein